MSKRSQNLEDPSRLGARVGDITIDQAIEALQIAKRRSPLGGNTVIHLCEEDIEYRVFRDIGIETDSSGAVCLFSMFKLAKGYPEQDGLPPTCLFLDAIDKMSPDERLARCQMYTHGEAGGWPDSKCIKFLREKLNIPKSY